jgi:hypothetical protein
LFLKSLLLGDNKQFFKAKFAKVFPGT